MDTSNNRKIEPDLKYLTTLSRLKFRETVNGLGLLFQLLSMKFTIQKELEHKNQ